MASLGLLASLGMAVGAPLVYADQAWSIGKRRNSEGFSKDVCAVLLIANIARCFWWFHERFEFALLLQSILMIAAQLGLLSLVLRYQPGSYASSAYTSSYEDYLRSDPGPASSRPNQQQHPQITVVPPTPSTETSNPLANQSRSQTSNPAFDSLFSTVSGDGGASKRGISLPFLGNVTLPSLPILDDSRGGYSSTSASAPSGLADEDDDEIEDQDPVSLPTRAARTAKKTARTTFKRLGPLLGIRNDGSVRADGSSSARPFGFWTWRTLASYLIFLMLYTTLLATLQVIFNSSSTYNAILSYFSLGLESSLPLPQFLSNQSRRSLAGFRISVLLGWLFGDGFKTGYFIINSSPLPFLIGGVFALAIDIAIVVQWKLFEDQTRSDEEAERLVQEERQRREAGDRTGTSQQQSQQRQQRSSQSPAPSSRPREASLDQELEDIGDAHPILFDSQRQHPRSSSPGTTGGVQQAERVFTIEADED